MFLIHYPSTKKKLEYVCKRITLGPTISAIPPAEYAYRFRVFAEKIFSDPYEPS
jgi:1-phosphatidylinositol-4-phosphate 5-kinase